MLFSRSGTCSTVPSGPRADVEDLASRLLHITDLFGRYNLLSNNCENFAHFCSTGSSRSLQVESLITSSLIFMVLLMLAPMKEFITVLIMWANTQGYISTEYATAKMIDASVRLISLFLFIYLFILLGDIRESSMHSFFILEKLKQEQGDYQPPQWLINACKMPGQEEVDKQEEGDYQPPQWLINKEEVEKQEQGDDQPWPSPRPLLQHRLKLSCAVNEEEVDKQEEGDYQPPHWLINEEEVDKQEQGDDQPRPRPMLKLSCLAHDQPPWLINALKMRGQEEVDKQEEGDDQPLRQLTYGDYEVDNDEKMFQAVEQVQLDDQPLPQLTYGDDDVHLAVEQVQADDQPPEQKEVDKSMFDYIGFREVDKSMFDYVGFWQKELKALLSEHLKASVLENIDNQVGQTGGENILRDHIKMDRDTLEAGHHIYCFGQGKIHTHHGIYIGETKVEGSSPPKFYKTVIHYTRTEGGKESSSSKTCLVCSYRSDLHRGVVKTCLDCFLAGQDQIYWYVYGVSVSVASSFPVGSCSTKQSKPSFKAVECASQLLESGFKDYNPFFNNSKDFAQFCKAGDPKSSRTDYVTNSLWSFTQNIIKLATEMDYFGLGGSASVKTFVFVLLLLWLIFVSLLFLLVFLCSSGLRHLGVIFRWLKQLCFKFYRRFQRFKIE